MILSTNLFIAMYSGFSGEHPEGIRGGICDVEADLLQ